MERLTRKITAEVCYNLPTTPPTAKRHIRYRLSVEEIEEC